MKKLLIIFLFLVVCSCASKNIEDNSYQSIMQKEDYLIIDVRTKEEYNESHIKKAINISYDEINANSDIPKDKTIFVYCRSGARSSIAYNTLKNLGYKVYDLGAFNSIDLEKE